jgi:hypothetical protein
MFCLKCFKCCNRGPESDPPLPPKLVSSPQKSSVTDPSEHRVEQNTIKPPKDTIQRKQNPPSLSSPKHRPPPSTNMAPSLQVESPLNPLSPGAGGHWRRISGGLHDFDSVSNGAARSVVSRRISRKTAGAGESSNISNVVYSLKRRSGDELGVTTSSKLLNANHATLLDWIRHQRMSKIPPEGSSYDKVLAWAQLFVERLHSFDLAIEHFAGDSYLAAQLAYGYCAILLEVRVLSHVMSQFSN